MHLIDYRVSRHGVCLGKTSERLVVKEKGEVIREIPFRHLRSILIDARGVSLSSTLVDSCSRFGVEIHFMDYRSRTIARLARPNLHETAATMRGQFAAAHNGKSIELAKMLVREKIKAQRRLINYHKRRANLADQPGEVERFLAGSKQGIARIDAMQRGLSKTRHREQLMGFEGSVARLYWGAARRTVPEEMKFERREYRGAQDVVNRMLNYGYALLEARVWSAVERAGLHPYEGVLHVERAGRPSMVLDLMEPWRILVDDAVFSIAANSRQKGQADFETYFKKELTREVINRLEARRVYGNKRLPTRECFVEAARNIGVYFRDEGNLRPFRWDIRGAKRAKRG